MRSSCKPSKRSARASRPPCAKKWQMTRIPRALIHGKFRSMPSPSIDSVAVDAWPALPLEAWRDTYDTLHMWTQVVGKLALALSPLTNHYWNTALQITPRGLATLPLPVGRRLVTVTFDLAHTRFSGRRAPRHPGGIPNLADAVTRESYSHECISMGWWLGGGSTPIVEPAFYAYAYPEPPGCPDAVIAPISASYDLRMHEWILPYEAVRRAPDPDATVLAFAQSTYEAAADLGGWERALLER